MVRTRTAYAFFYLNAPHSFDASRGETLQQGRARCAKELATAEKFARNACYSFQWVTALDLQGADTQWICLARDASGKIVARQGGQVFPDGEPWAHAARRICEAELAMEAIGNENKRKGAE